MISITKDPEENHGEPFDRIFQKNIKEKKVSAIREPNLINNLCFLHSVVERKNSPTLVAL
ncbi:MAG: hypothetical protein Tsb0015_16980 [Simkaniaceae bacterium]